MINQLERDIIQYLVKLSNTPLTEKQHVQLNVLIKAINDIERVGDHADNIAELVQIELIMISYLAIRLWKNYKSYS